MTIMSLLFLALVAIAAYIIITKFFPAGWPQMLSLAIVGVMLLLYLLQGFGVSLGGKLF